MNVTELARQLKTTREELLAKLPELGFDIGGRAIKIDNAIAERIKRSWAQHLRTERLRAKMRESSERVEAQKKLEAGAGTIQVGNRITVSNFAAKLGTPVAHLVGYLMKNGIMASLNQEIDFETASIVSEDYGFRIERASAGSEVEAEAGATRELKALKLKISQDTAAIARPPVVVVMGHVDHGKTTLLDVIRETNVAAGESGGITQHIGAYQVEVPSKESSKSGGSGARLITFLDTPGHEAFKAMRERGGQVADVAILVVAADDGLKPQTLESINVIQKANLPFVVAINKIDKSDADVDRVKKELAEVNLNSEDWGGKTITVPISAKKKENITELLDMVLLVADLEKFTSNPDGDASGVIIESHIDPGEGVVATVLVNAGTLVRGQEVIIGETHGKIRALKNWRGEMVDAAPPSMPVKILGLKAAPRVGDILRVAERDRSIRKKRAKDYRFVDTERGSATEESGTEEDREGKTLNIIVRADALGSLEAFVAAVRKLGHGGVGISILKQGLGNITESDISFAQDSAAVVYGFNTRLSAEAKTLSYQRTVEIKISKIIYELLDDITARLKTLVVEELVEVAEGELHITNIFRESRAESIIGGRVKGAAISDGCRFRLMRNGEPVDEGRIMELQQNKQKVARVSEGVECGMKVSGIRGIHPGDVLACYHEEKKQVR